MGFGGRIRMLWRLRPGVAVSFVLAVAAAIWSTFSVSFSPPSLTARTMTMATASTQLIIDTPTSTMLDLRQDTYSFVSLRNRAILLGNVMASSPVRDDIAKRAHIPAGVLEVAAPRTPEQPRSVVGADAKKSTTDILKSNDQYRLSIQANPTVPVLDIYAESPDATSSAALANAAVDSLRHYLGELAQSERTAGDDQVRLVQLGRASGAVINGGISIQAAILAFLLTFAASCATVVFIHRVRRGWQLAALTERTSAD
jgi:hypothetical protein